MHFNIYLDDSLGERLTAATKESHKSRNALIREAIDLWLSTHEKTCWPDKIMEFKGAEDFPAFESHRGDLKQISDDPLA